MRFGFGGPYPPAKINPFVSLTLPSRRLSTDIRACEDYLEMLWVTFGVALSWMLDMEETPSGLTGGRLKSYYAKQSKKSMQFKARNPLEGRKHSEIGSKAGTLQRWMTLDNHYHHGCGQKGRDTVAVRMLNAVEQMPSSFAHTITLETQRSWILS